MNHLLNHIAICTMIYEGNTYGAIRLFDINFKKINQEACLANYKLFITSLNFSIFNYILIKENISLDKCCLKNSMYIKNCLDINSLLETGHKIIYSYLNCHDYLYEKFSNPEVKKAIAYMYSHLSENISLDDVCNVINLNKSYFCSLFKTHTGHTFSQHLNYCRINLAKSLIKSSNMTYCEVATHVGFNNYTYFCRIFKKLTNYSPHNYRLLYKAY